MRLALVLGVLACQVVQAEDKCQYAADPGHCYHQAGNLKMALQYVPLDQCSASQFHSLGICVRKQRQEIQTTS